MDMIKYLTDDFSCDISRWSILLLATLEESIQMEFSLVRVHSDAEMGQSQVS